MYELYIEDRNGVMQLADIGERPPVMNYQANDIAEGLYTQSNSVIYSSATLSVGESFLNCAMKS